MGTVGRRDRPPVITDAEYSQDDQLLSREIRYAIMMGIRAACLVVAAILVGVHAPLLKLWLPLLLIGMLVLPWFAVVLANDRPPKAKYRLATKLHRNRRQEPESQPSITGVEHKIVDHDEVADPSPEHVDHRTE
jgi:predicted tellurium resistance membrane protein TerC